LNIKPKILFLIGSTLFLSESVYYSQNVGINTDGSSPTTGAMFHVKSTNAVLFDNGALGSGTPLSLGAGTKFLWYPRKASIRAGQISNTEWDDANIGNHSAAFGQNNIASGSHSIAAGDDNRVSGNYSSVIGFENVNEGDYAFVSGYQNVFSTGTATNGHYTAVFGRGNEYAAYDLIQGFQNTSDNSYVTINGQLNDVGASFATVFGSSNTIGSQFAFASGQAHSIQGTYSTAFGLTNSLSANHTFASGQENTLSSVYSFANGSNNNVGGGGYNATFGTANTISGSAAYSFVSGALNTVSGTSSAALGLFNTVSGTSSFAAGETVNVSAHQSIGLGRYITVDDLHSVIIGTGTGVASANHLVVNNGNTFGVGFDHTSPTLEVYCQLSGTYGKVGLARTPLTNRLEVNGNASKSSAGSWLANSDGRLKKDINPIHSKDVLSRITQLQGVTYYWNDTVTSWSADRPPEIQYGFIAQDFQKEFPDLVSEDAEGYLQMGHGTLDPLFVEAFKAQQEQIEELKNEIEQLKNILREKSD